MTTWVVAAAVVGWSYVAAIDDPPTLEPRTAVATPPAKSWVWLPAQGCYGYGYRRPDGLWVIDPGTKYCPRAAQSPVTYGQASFNGPTSVSGVAGGCAGGTCGTPR